MAKTLITISFFLSVFLRIFPIDLSIGGDNFYLYAQVEREKFIYELLIENNKSKVLSKMRVYAHDENDARNQTELNGWAIIDVKRYQPQENIDFKSPNRKEFILKDNPADDVTPTKVDIASPLATEQEIIDKKLSATNKKPDDNYVPDFFSDNITITETDNATTTDITVTDNITVGTLPNNNLNDNQSKNNQPNSNKSAENLFAGYSENELLPDSDKLTLLTTIYYNLGEVTPSADIKGVKLADLDRSKKYVIMGHADEVRVGENAKYKSNFELSYMRANYIKDQLVKMGMTADNIKTLGLGVRYPAVPPSAEGNKLNRRVEIYGFR